MIKLMTAQEANNLSSKNNQEVSISLAMNWLKKGIEDACNDGSFEVAVDIQAWSLMTNMQGFRVKVELKSLGYKVEDCYEDIVSGDAISRIKKVRISWGDNNESERVCKTNTAEYRRLWGLTSSGQNRLRNDK